MKAIVEALTAANGRINLHMMNRPGGGSVASMPHSRPATRSVVNTQPLHVVRRETEQKMRALQTLDSKLAHMTRPR